MLVARDQSIIFPWPRESFDYYAYVANTYMEGDPLTQRITF